MELVIQLGTDCEDERALDLLSFPEHAFEDPDPGCQVEIWASGRRTSRRRKQQRDAVALLAEGQWNEAFLSCGERRWPGRGTAVSVRKRITVSPRNRLWKPPFEDQSANRYGAQAQATHESLHNFVAWNAIRHYPTMVQVALRLGEGGDGDAEDELFEELVQLIWRGLDDRATAVCSFGCVDCNSRGFSITDRLARWPKAISELGGRFDDLHPALLGDLAACRRLQQALEPHQPARDLRHRGDFGMLVLGRRWDESLRDRAEVCRCLAPRRDPGIRAAEPSKGEYALGEADEPRHFYIERSRFLELFGAEALADRSTGARYWETLDPEVCAAAGVIPAEVLVAYSMAGQVAQARSGIRHRYAALDDALPPRQRVWRAHEDVFREMGETLFGVEAAEAIDLIRERSF